MANKVTERMAPADRKAQLLDIAVSLAKKHGMQAVSRNALAERAGVTAALVTHVFKGADAMKWETLQTCAAQRDVKVIASALTLGYRVADIAPLVSREVLRQAKAMVPKGVELVP